MKDTGDIRKIDAMISGNNIQINENSKILFIYNESFILYSLKLLMN
jgi:hypothetical protein